MSWFHHPAKVEAAHVSGAVRIRIAPAVTFLPLMMDLGFLLFWSYYFGSAWHHLGWFHRVLFVWGEIAGAWEAMRQLVATTSVEIAPSGINISRPWIFGGNRHYSAERIRNFGARDEAGKLHSLGFIYGARWITLAASVDQADLELIQQLVAGIGGIGRSPYDPFGKDKRTITLGLND